MCCSGSPEDVSVAVGVGRTLEKYLIRMTVQRLQTLARSPCWFLWTFRRLTGRSDLPLGSFGYHVVDNPGLAQTRAQGPPYIGIMEKKMETTIVKQGVYIGVIFLK